MDVVKEDMKSEEKAVDEGDRWRDSVGSRDP